MLFDSRDNETVDLCEKYGKIYGAFSKIYFHEVGLPLKKKEETVSVEGVVYCKTEGERE